MCKHYRVAIGFHRDQCTQFTRATACKSHFIWKV